MKTDGGGPGASTVTAAISQHPLGVRQRGSPDPPPASSPPAAPVKEIRTDRHYPRIITWAPVVQVKTSLWHTDESRYGSTVSVLPSCRREGGVGVGDPGVAGYVVGEGQQPAEATGHRVFGHRRVSELPELFQRGVAVGHPQGGGRGQVVGDAGAEDLQRPLRPGGGGGRGGGRAPQVRVIEGG